MPHSMFVKQGEVAAPGVRRISIDWVITSMCNYTCYYCPKHDAIDTNSFSTKDELFNAADFIAGIGATEYNITFSGGEPTIHPHLIATIQYIHSQLKAALKRIDIITNGSRSSEYFGKLRSLVDSSVTVCLTISLHVNFAKLPHIQKLLAELSDKINISVQVLLDFDHLEKAFSICEQLLTFRDLHPFSVNPILIMNKPLYQQIDGRYTEDHFVRRQDFIKRFSIVQGKGPKSKISQSKLTPSLIAWKSADGTSNMLARPDLNRDRATRFQEGLFDFNGMYCAMGSRVLAIYADGTCTGAQCSLARPYSTNVFRNNNDACTAVLRAVKCSAKRCGCAANDVIPKFSDPKDADLYIEQFLKGYPTGI